MNFYKRLAPRPRQPVGGRLIVIASLALCCSWARADVPAPHGAEIGSADESIQTALSPQELLEQGRQQSRALEFDRAFESFSHAVEVSRRLGEPHSEAEALLAMGLTHRQAGAPLIALRWIEEAVQIYADIKAKDDQAGVLCDLARSYNAVGQRDLAWKHLDTAEDLFRQLDDPTGLGRVDSLRSLVAVHQGRFDVARRFGDKARGNGMTPPGDRVRAAANVAYALHQQRRLPQALAAYDEVLELAWQNNDQRQIGFAYCNRAEVRWLLGKSKPAIEDLWKAVHGFEQARTLIPSTSEQRSAFMGRQIASYDRLIRYLVDTSQSKTAFEVAERFHARSFLEMLDHRAADSLNRRHPKLVAARDRVLDDLGRSRLALEEERPGDPQLLQQITDLETDLLAVEAQLLWRGRDPRQHTAAPAPTLQQVSQGLGQGEALITYWVSADRILAWSVLDGTTRLTQLPISSQDLAKAVQEYLAPLRSPSLAEDLAVTGGERRHLAIGRRLHDWLVASLPPEVLAARRWILVPDGILHYLPFESLVVACPSLPAAAAAASSVVHGIYASCRYLGLEKPLAYSPSAGAFLALRQRLRARHPPTADGSPTRLRGRLLALAPSAVEPTPSSQTSAGLEAAPSEVAPLEVAELRRGLLSRAPLLYARQEAERIAALFPGSSSWVAEQASEGRLKQAAGDYRFLHLATHGLVSDELPMSSGLLLAADSGEDGLLQAHEVLGLDLTADLVTLSACRTGRGQLRRGEGIVGLSRAFLTAGASAVLVSLWDIDDRSTPLLMETFYRYLAVGIPAPEALVKARHSLFTQQGSTRLVLQERPVAYAHPRFWASFVLSGGF